MMTRPYMTVLTSASISGYTIHNCMESIMRDILLQCSGLAAIAAAIIHGVLGETKVFPRTTIEPRRLRTLFRLVWQASTVDWIVATMAFVFAFAALANAWATRGRHFGWMALSAVVAMAVAGY